MKCNYSSRIGSYDASLKIIEPKLFSSIDEIESIERDKFLLILPWATLSSFYIEICCKALIVADGRAPRHIHDLEKLFIELPSRLQKLICDKLVRYDFNEELSHISNVFIQSRYLTEYQFSIYFLRDLRFAFMSLEQIKEMKKMKVYRKSKDVWLEIES